MTPGPLLLALLRASLEGGAFLLILWFACRAWPRMPATARTTLWWLGSLRLLAGLIPLPRIPLSLVPSSETLAAVGNATLGPPVTAAIDVARQAVAAPAAFSASAGASPIGWALAGLIALWLSGIVAAALMMVRRLMVLRRQWRRAAPVTDPRVVALRNDWAIVLGRERVPEVRTAEGVTVPVTVGVWRTGVLLPPASERWSDDTLRLVFAHEMGHVRRWDPLLAWIPALAELVFWFHPLARLAAREYLAAREESCDAEALCVTGAAAGDYGALLLEFGVGRIAALPGSASCGAVNGRALKRRLDMLTQSWRIPRSHRFAGVLTVVLFLLLAFAPVRLVGANEEGKAAGSRHATPPFSYLLFKKGEDGSRGSAAMVDFDNIEKFKSGKRNPENLTYFRIEKDAWVSRDPMVFAEVTAALDPIDRNEAKRAPLEARRREMEREQQHIEARFEDLEQRRERLQERRAALDAARDKGKAERELAAMRDDIETEMDSLTGEREAMSRDREKLSDQYRALNATESAAYAEQDRVQQQVLMSILRIARRAIDEGRVEPLER